MDDERMPRGVVVHYRPETLDEIIEAPECSSFVFDMTADEILLGIFVAVDR